jgi:hypothetical protein
MSATACVVYQTTSFSAFAAAIRAASAATQGLAVKKQAARRNVTRDSTLPFLRVLAVPPTETKACFGVLGLGTV